jgi:arsenite methyltransferase
MKSTHDSATLKEFVRATYADIVTSPERGGCCGPTASTTCFADDYASISGHVAEADYGLGCGIPTRHARLAPGETVLDLGSGAGNDVFIAAAEVGPTGHAIGVDFTPEMVERALANARSIGASNVDFRLGDLEDMPVDDASVDVIVSNCVLNLVPDKHLAFREMNRVLKPGGRFAISDIVTLGELPSAIRQSPALYAACVSGAIEKHDYLAGLQAAGFIDVSIASEKGVGMDDPSAGGVDVANVLASITVTGRKPS